MGGEASARVVEEFGVADVGLFVPLPRIHERLRLRAVFAADVVVDLVVVALTVERGINVAEVYGFVFDVFAQDFEIVAIVECVHAGRFGGARGISCLMWRGAGRDAGGRVAGCRPVVAWRLVAGAAFANEACARNENADEKRDAAGSGTATLRPALKVPPMQEPLSTNGVVPAAMPAELLNVSVTLVWYTGSGGSAMPRRDNIHAAIKNALVKDGWTITNDPYRIEYEDADVYADLRIEKTLPGELPRRVLVIEIKEFAGPSPMNRLEEALGQYQVYRSYLRQIAPEEQLYLAVDKASYDSLFARLSFQRIVDDYQLSLVIVDVPNEEVARWID